MIKALDYLGKQVNIIIDRPIGSKHPEYDLVYEVNYGFISGEMAPDNDFLDAYVIGELIPLERFEGECIAVIHRMDDIEDKLVVAQPGNSLTDEQIIEKTNFIEKYFKSKIIRK